jgi:hypothetical protein
MENELSETFVHKKIYISPQSKTAGNSDITIVKEEGE